MSSRMGYMNIAADAMTPLSGLPLIEICGQNRILIENHRGISGYSGCEIQVKVCFGRVIVCGENLKVTNMSKEKLVIVGNIYAVNLQGRR